MRTPEHVSRPPRLDRYFESRPLFFITFNTWNREPALANAPAHNALVAYCRKGIELGRVEVGRYVIMPDHVHLFLRGDDAFNPGLWIRGLKRAISNAVDATPGLWQDGFFDHVLRHDESYAEKWEYVRLNPLRAGLVTSADAWPYQGELVAIDRA